MTSQFCPTCSCIIGTDAYEKEGIAYCCEPCANGGARECGCCKPVVVERESEEKKAKPKKGS